MKKFEANIKLDELIRTADERAFFLKVAQQIAVMN